MSTKWVAAAAVGFHLLGVDVEAAKKQRPAESGQPCPPQASPKAGGPCSLLTACLTRACPLNRVWPWVWSGLPRPLLGRDHWNHFETFAPVVVLGLTGRRAPVSGLPDQRGAEALAVGQGHIRCAALVGDLVLLLL
jgi:hypothetical protein